MAEKCFPLEATEYTAEDAQLWFATRTSGVYANGHLGVTAGEDMQVTLGKGIAWLHYDEFVGCVYGNTSELVLTAEMSDGQYSRIDRVCIRLERLANRCYAYIKKGTAAEMPAVPELQRDNTAYEISVAQIRVGVGVTAITAADITDERLDETVCGIMRDGVTGIDTSMMQAQFTAMLETFTVEQQAAFEEWFEGIQTILDGDVAGNLANMVIQRPVMHTSEVIVDRGLWIEHELGEFTIRILAEGVLLGDEVVIDLTGLTVENHAAVEAAWSAVWKAEVAADERIDLYASAMPAVDLPLKVTAYRMEVSV